MFRSVSAGLDWLYLAAGWLAGGLLVAMCGLVAFNILARLLDFYSGGAAEYAGYTMAASSFLGLAYTFRSDGHIRVSLLIDRCGMKSRRWMEVLGTGILVIVVSYFAYHCVDLVFESRYYGDVSEGPDATPLWIAQIPMAAGAAIFAISCVHAFVLAILGKSPTGSEVVKVGEVMEI